MFLEPYGYFARLLWHGVFLLLAELIPYWNLSPENITPITSLIFPIIDFLPGLSGVREARMRV